MALLRATPYKIYITKCHRVLLHVYTFMVQLELQPIPLYLFLVCFSDLAELSSET